jgi:hypothetical protein
MTQFTLKQLRLIQQILVSHPLNDLSDDLYASRYISSKGEMWFEKSESSLETLNGLAAALEKAIKHSRLEELKKRSQEHHDKCSKCDRYECGYCAIDKLDIAERIELLEAELEPQEA